MLKMTVNDQSSNVTQRASSIETNQLFRDEDGDLYLRCVSGAIRFSHGGGMIAYSDRELDDNCLNPYLLNCLAVTGDVKLEVTV
jgi:hypothetical protein